MREELRLRLLELGASDDDIERAVAQGWLPLLVLDSMLMPGRQSYDLAGLAAAAGSRTVLAAGPGLPVAVGFADLSGYTKLSAALDASELSALVGRFEAVAYDTIAASGARVVKTIGDEVMYVGLTNETVAASLALRD